MGMNEGVREFATPQELMQDVLEKVKSEALHRGRMQRFETHAGTKVLLAEAALNLLRPLGFDGHVGGDALGRTIRLTSFPDWLFTYEQKPTPPVIVHIELEVLAEVLGYIPISDPLYHKISLLVE